MANVFKKTFASVAAMAIVAGSMNIAAIASAAGSISAEFDAAFDWMAAEGITSMATQEAYNPFGGLNRQYGTTLIVRGLKAAGVSLTMDPDANCSFGDESAIDPSVLGAVLEACNYGLVKGYNGIFDPNATMNRAQVMTVIGRALYGQQAEGAQYWAAYYALLNADGIFTIENANANMMRYELGLVLYRIATGGDISDGGDDIDDVLCELLGTCDDTEEEVTEEEETEEEITVEGEVDGGVHVALASSSAVGGFVPGTGSNINVMKVDILAGDDTIAVDAINFKLQGLMSREHVESIKLVDANGIAVSNDRSLTSTNTARLVFEGDFVVPANEIRSVYLYVETKGSINEIFNFAILTPADVETNTDMVTGSFPIVSNSFQTTEYSSTSVTFEGDTAVEDTSKEEIYVGETDREVGDFQLTIGSQNNKDVVIDHITLRSIDQVDVLDNFRLAVGSDSNVAESVVVDGKYVTFIFEEDFVMEYGDTRTFYIYADVVAGEDNDEVNFFLDETSDISAYEAETNASVQVSINNAYLEGYDIQEGDSLITRRSDSPASSFIATDADYINVLIGNVYLSAEMDVDEFRVYAEGTAIAGNDIERVRLYVNGKQIDETSTYVGTSPNGYYEFSLFDTLVGSNEFVVKVDTESTATDGNTFKATIKPESITEPSGNAEYTTSKNNVATADINGTAVGGTMTIKAPDVQSVTRTDSNGTAEEVVAGAQLFEAIKFVVQANNVRDLTINSFDIEVTSGSSDNVSEVRVVVDGYDIDNPLKSRSFSSSTVTLSSLNINVPKGGTTEITVFATIDTSYATAGTENLEFTVDNLDVEDEDGNPVPVSTTLGATSAMFDVTDGATLIANIHTDTPDEEIVTAGIGQDIAVFEFEAVDDNGLIQELAFINLSGGFASDSATSGDYANRLTGANSADGAVVEAYDVDGNKLGEAALTDGVVHFTFDTPVVLPRDNGGSKIILKANPKAISSAAASNTTIKLAFLEPGNTVGDSIRTFITSDANGLEISNTTAINAISEIQYVRKAILTVGSVTTNNQLISQDGFPLFMFTASSDSASNDVLVKELRFDVSVNGDTTLTGFELARGSTDFAADEVEFKTYDSACSAITGGTAVANITTGSNCVAAIFIGDEVNGLAINAEREFTLKANVNGVADGGDSVSVRIDDVSTDATKDTYANTNAKVASIIWSDSAAQPTTTGSVNWFTDAYVEDLATASWSAAGTN